MAADQIAKSPQIASWDALTATLTTGNAYADVGSWAVGLFAQRRMYFSAATNNLTVTVLGSIDGGVTYPLTAIAEFAVATATPVDKQVLGFFTHIKVQVKPTVPGAHGTLSTLIAGSTVPRSDQATADGDNVVLGSTTDAAVKSAAATGTLSGKLRGLVEMLFDVWDSTLHLLNVNTRTKGYSSGIVSTTRPNDTAVYAANDVLGSATGSTAALTFPTMGPAAGGEILLTSVIFERDAAALISGETSYTLHLYNIAPPSVLGDNAAWDLPSGDRASYLGSISLGTPVDLGSTLYVATDGINKQLTLASGTLYGYLVTVGTYTPLAQAIHKITLHSVAV